MITETELQTERDPLRSAIARAQTNLLRLQHNDGHWCGELVVDSTLVSDYIAYMH
jgi:squalene-hopene/tetraprenyl-beta-curcumene cyclase